MREPRMWNAAGPQTRQEAGCREPLEELLLRCWGVAYHNAGVLCFCLLFCFFGETVFFSTSTKAQ
jgi:hypothetical protein